ncbi:MAG: hypothetical protein E7231_01080 [Cellulosilyticum sp.]|nr:hypothetical protein [Cellulosilyticum sp.]
MKMINNKIHVKQNTILLIVILLLSVLTIFYNNIVCDLTYGQKRAIIINAQAAVESKGSCTASLGDGNGEVVVVQNGEIVNKEILYMCGASDSDFAQWGATANNEQSTASVSEISNSESDTSSTEPKSDTSDKSSSTANTKQTPNSSMGTYTEEEIDKAWEEENRLESTCTKIGQVYYTNSITGETKTEELPLADHKYAETERKEATCTEAGAITYACEVCGDTYTEEIPALGHEYEWSTTKEATLFASGEEKYICRNCGDVSETREIPATCPIPIAGIVGIVIISICLVGGIIIKKKKEH